MREREGERESGEIGVAKGGEKRERREERKEIEKERERERKEEKENRITFVFGNSWSV
jgi:hypothetical protein